MDDRRFDALTRSLGTLSRRGLMGATATILHAAAPEVAGKKKGKKRKKGCRPACQTCQQCVRGKCIAAANRTPCGRCRECIGGTCVNLPDGTGCGSSCEQCRGGECRSIADDSPCDGDGKCLAGVCNARPACLGVGSSCSGNGDCCAQVCNAGFTCWGLPSMPDGAECRVNDDCVSGHCRGYRCVGAGSCLSKTTSYCADGVSWGNAEETCPCLLGDDPGGGIPFARPGAQPQRPGFSCGDCTKTQDCIDKWGPDAFCAFLGSTYCPCPQAPNRACVLPC